MSSAAYAFQCQRKIVYCLSTVEPRYFELG